MFVVPGRADLIKDHHALIADMRAQLADNGITQPPKAVVLDTLNKSLIGSESKDIDMANYIAAAEAIQKAFGGLVIIVHHHGIEESRPRGHTSLRGAVDVQIKITRDEQNNIIAVIEDMRDGPEGAQIASRLVVVEVGQEVTGKPKTSAAVEPADATLARRPLDLTPNQRTMLSLLEEAGPKGLTADGWNAKARTAGLAKHRHATLVDLRAALRRKNLAVERDGVWLVMSDRIRDL
jgi:AAA domain